MLQSTKTIFKQTSIYGAGNIIRKLSGVFILPLIKGFTSSEEFGVWMLFETIFLFTQVLSGLGVKSGFTRWYYEMPTEKEKKALFFTTSIFNYGISAVIVTFLGIALYFYSTPILKFPVSGRLILIFSFSGLFRLFQDLPFIVLRLKQKAAKQTLYSTINVVLLILFTYYFLVQREEGFEGVFMAQLWSNLLTFIILLPVFFKNSRWGVRVSELKKMINYGLPLALSNILTTILSISDRHIINQFYNPAESGNYGLALKVANLLEMIFVASFITSFTYYYYKKMNDPDSLKIFNKLQRYFTIIILMAGLGIVLFSSEIIWLVSAGDDYYQEGIYLVPFLILGLAFAGMRQFFSLPLHKHKKTPVISRILIIAGFLNIGLNFIFVPIYGKQGAAWATLLVQLFSMISFYIVANKYESISVNLKETISLLFLWCVFASGILIMPDVLWLGIVLKVILLGVFVLLLVAFKIIRKEEIGEMKNILNDILRRRQINE